MSDPFLPSVDFVLSALNARRGSGASMKASGASLAVLCSAARFNKTVEHKTVEHKPAPIPQIRTQTEEVRTPSRHVGERTGENLAKIVSARDSAPQSRPVTSRLLGGSKSEQLAALRAESFACQLCPNLARSRSSVVFGEGNCDAELMLIGEAPGAEEDLAGEPFVGEAGELLRKILTAMGISREAVYIANVLKCRPDVPPGAAGNRKPTVEEMGRCLPYLHQQIKIVQPRVIVALGATAMHGLFGKTEPMARLRSNWYSIQDIPVMATYHPLYLLRNQALSEKRKVWEDLLKVLERLDYPISEKQRGFFLKASG